MRKGALTGEENGASSGSCRPGRRQVLRTRRDALEAAWLEEEAGLFRDGAPDISQLHSFAARAAYEEQKMVDEFSRDSWSHMPGRGFFAKYWRKKNASLGVRRWRSFERTIETQ